MLEPTLEGLDQRRSWISLAHARNGGKDADTATLFCHARPRAASAYHGHDPETVSGYFYQDRWDVLPVHLF